MSKLLVVTGATGFQVGSLVNAVLNHKDLRSQWKIRAVTRDPSGPKGEALKARGVEVVKGDYNDPDSMRAAFKGAHTVFGTTNYWEYLNKDKETTQGNALVDAAKAEGVKHFIWSSLPDADKITNGKFKNIWHFDGKAATERYLIDSGIPWTCFYAGMYMSNFLRKDGVKLLKIGENAGGELELRLPCSPNALFPLYDVMDTGLYITPILQDPGKYLSKRVYSGTYTGAQEIVDVVSRVTGAGKGVIKTVPVEEFKKEKFPPPVPEIISHELIEQLLLLDTDMPGYYGGIELGSDRTAAETVNDQKLMTWENYVAANRDRFIEHSKMFPNK